MRTKLIYEEQPYLKKWTTKVVDVIEDSKGQALVFEETIFYPEGGGQPFDLGEIKILDQNYLVVEVQKKDNQVYHYLKSKLRLANVKGLEVIQSIDWERRYEFMRWHSGEHLFSGIILELFGSHNKGFHIGKEGIICDYDRYFEDGEVDIIFEKVMEAILDNQEIVSSYPEEKVLKDLPYRSKKEINEAIRIVTLGTHDICACCGTHVKRTGEIGPLKIVSKERFKGGTRFNILFGNRATKDYYSEAKILKKIADDFSTSSLKVQDNILKLRKKSEESKEREILLQDMLIESIVDKSQEETFFEYYPSLDSSFIRKLGEALNGKASYSFLLAGKDKPYDFCLTGEDNIIQPLWAKLREKLSIKGGGRGGLISGKVEEEIANIWHILERKDV